MHSEGSPRQAGSPVLLETLRQAVLVGDLLPGERLVEGDLALRFVASRGAVREALALLDNEGLVTRQANRGAWVRTVSVDETIEFTEVRAVLEGLCAAKAAARATAGDREALRRLLAEMQAAVGAGDVLVYCAASRQMHQAIRQMADQHAASDALNRLQYLSGRYQVSVSLLPGRPARGTREHEAVVQAVVSGDADFAERTMRDHLGNVVAALKQLKEMQQPALTQLAGTGGGVPPVTNLPRLAERLRFLSTILLAIALPISFSAAYGGERSLTPRPVAAVSSRLRCEEVDAHHSGTE
ncbi:MAG TPA: GntR family transcriptional regulator [Trebonia sp.]|jgi:DNA-binding GntR family transcriptional regulator